MVVPEKEKEKENEHEDIKDRFVGNIQKKRYDYIFFFG